jgi:O-antigen/teichoic acid export membrane protein
MPAVALLRRPEFSTKTARHAAGKKMSLINRPAAAATSTGSVPATRLSPSWTRVLSVLGANGFGQAISVVMQLVALPIFLHFWSLEQYGLWLLISAAPAYFSLADVGVGTVAMNRMTMFAAQGRQDSASRIFGIAVGITAASTLLLLAVAMAVIWSFELGPVRDVATRLPLSLLVIVMLIGTFTPLIDGQFRASGRFATGALVIHVSRLVEWSGGIAGLVAFRTMTAVAVGSLAGRLAATAVTVIWTSRHLPGYRWRIVVAKRDELRELLPQAAAFLALPVGNAFILQGVSIAVGSTFGPAALAVFSAFRTLSRIPVQLLTMFSRSLWPELSRSYGAGDLLTLGRLYRRASWISLLGCTAACVAVYVSAPLVLELWSHDKIAMDVPLLGLFLLAALAGCAWQMEQVLLSATNTHVHLSLWYFLASLAVVLAAALLPENSGMEAVVALLVLFELAMLVVSRRLVAIPLGGLR